MNAMVRPVPVGFDYVLILEWLSEGDARTGAELHEFLRTIGFRSEVIVCHSWPHIQQALMAARDAADAKGIPIVHFETHGANLWVGDPAAGIGFGPNLDSTPVWARLGPLLAPLNVRTGFRLLVVAAACWGSGIIAAIDAGEHPAPFACAVGLRTAVTEGRLREAMRELYRRLRDRLPLIECVDSVQRELEDGQELRLEVIVDVAMRMLATLCHRRRVALIGPLRWRRNTRLVWNAWFPPSLQAQVPAYRFENIDPM
ncbi:MAG TPA: hypothetical protein VFN79_11335 [Steroidobacteraceae bacterium]|nr:hypothetical protein [Steroidobacteraceae bacterium]